MEELTIMLNNINDSYYGFVLAVLTYVKKKESRFDKVKKYIEDTPDALTSDVLEYISSQDDFYEDAAYSRAKVC